MDATTENNSLDKEQILNEFRLLIYRGDIDAILPFLQQYQKGNLSILKDTLKQAKRYWKDGKDFPNNQDINPQHNFNLESWHRANKKSNENTMLTLLACALCNLSDINTTWWFFDSEIKSISKEPKKLEILKMLQPKWLTEYLKNQVRGQAIPHPYQAIRLFEQHQIIHFDPELYALTIADIRWSEYHHQYTTDPITYQRDIPTLLDYETRLFEYEVDWQTNTFFWKNTFIKLIQEQKMKRIFFIQKTLEIQTKNWYSHAKAFFKKILPLIEVTTEEWLSVQDSIFLLLHSEYNATVNFAIETINQIFKQPDFNFTEYLTWLTAVMPRNDVKKGIKIILQQMDTALKQNLADQEEILSLVADTFLQNDFSLQERAAKILNKHLKPQHQMVIDKIQMYQENMIGGVAVLLQSYLNPEPTEQQESTISNYCYTVPKPHYLNPEKAIQLPQTWDELLCLMGESIHSNRPLDHDILMSAWLILKPQFPKDYQKQLKPIIKQMLKLTNNRFQDMFQYFFTEIYEKPHKSPENRYYDYVRFAEQYHYFLENFAEFSYEDIALPLLSLPTHAPSYIDPEILVKRLLAYQQQNVKFDFIDLGIALCRTPHQNLKAALALLPQIQHPQLQQLLYFAFGKIENSPEIPFKSSLENMKLNEQNTWWGLWDTVIQTHYRDSMPEPDLYRIEAKNKKGLLYIETPTSSSCGNSYIYKTFKKSYSNDSVLDSVFYHHLTPLSQVHNDLKFADSCCSCLYSLSYYSDLQPLLAYFIAEDYILNPYSLLILATNSVHQLKDVRLNVTEAFIQCFEQQKVDLAILAQHYAILIYANYAPFSRLIECLTHIKGSSDLNNQALIQLIGFILTQQQFPEKMPTQFKKLFELYYELIYQYQIKIDVNMLETLNVWQTQFPSLKSIIQKIVKEVA